MDTSCRPSICSCVKASYVEFQIEQQINRAGLGKHFHFTGLISPADIPKTISAMDILAHTSLREGLARALPQALLTGRPVVSFDVDGAREVCITDQTGILVDAKDVHGLQEAILTLAESTELRNQYGMRGQQMCKQMYSHEVMTDQIRLLYQNILSENS